MPRKELTFKHLCDLEEKARRSKEIDQEVEMQRESVAMFREDWLLFEKLFISTQLSPHGWQLDALRRWEPFGDLSTALEWLRTPTMEDAGICGGHLPCGPWLHRCEVLSKLPGTAALRQELDSRRVSQPMCMMLYLGSGWVPQRWEYLKAAEILRLGQRTYSMGEEHFVFWKRQAFPWVQMPLGAERTMDFLRSRAIALSAQELRLRALAWKPQRS